MKEHFIFYSLIEDLEIRNITGSTTARNSIDLRNISYMCFYTCRFVKHYGERESCRSSGRSVDVNSRLKESRRWYNVGGTKGQATRSYRDHVSSHRRGLAHSNHLVSPLALTTPPRSIDSLKVNKTQPELPEGAGGSVSVSTKCNAINQGFDGKSLKSSRKICNLRGDCLRCDSSQQQINVFLLWIRGER